MPRSLSSVTTAAWPQSTPACGLTGAVQTLSTPSPGASHARLVGAAGRSTGWLLAHWRAMDGHPEALVDLGAIRSNVTAIVQHVGGAQVMAVVKSDGYGHGMIETARAALLGGATWLGVGHV